MNGIGLYTDSDDFLTIKDGFELTRENVRRVLLTEPGERVNNPLYGSPLKAYIFEPEPIVRGDIELGIIDAINRWVPNVTVINFSINDDYDENKIRVSMELQDNQTQLRFNYDTMINY